MSKRAAIDLDEIAPNRFAIGNPHLNSVIRQEGVITGRVFDLTGWRREGLIGRLRERGFTVRTIADRIAALPAPPAPLPLGGAGWRPLATALEQFSHFDLRQLRWQPLAPEPRAGVPGVSMCDGWVLRRRKGRGPPSFYLAHKERAGGIGLRPIGETSALLQGYAQAVEFDPRPLLAAPPATPDGPLLVPAIELPAPYRAALELCAARADDGWLVQQRDWPAARALFERLGLELTVAP